MQLRFQTALYWAEKAATASDGSFQDVYMLGKCMYFCKQYHRAAQLITQAHLHEVSIFFLPTLHITLIQNLF